MGINYNPKTVVDGLTTYYDFANPKCYGGSGIVVTDMSKAQQNATIVNGAVYSADSKGVINFDGINDYIGTNTNATSKTYSAWTVNGVYGYPTEKTIEIWFKTTESGGLLVSRPWNGAGQYNYTFRPYQLGVVVGGSGSVNTPGQSNGISFANKADGNWHQGVFFMDKIKIGISIDGNDTYSQQNHNFTSGSLMHGGYSNYGDANLPTTIMSLYPYGQGWTGNTGFSISGSVAIFKQYNRVLTPAEIQQNFQATRGRFGL